MMRRNAQAKRPVDWSMRFDQWQLEARDARLQSFYGGGMLQADTPIVNVPMLAMDFETTGMQPDTDRIISIGIVTFTLARILCRESAYWVLNPGRPLNAESVVIHSITHEEVAEAPALDSILERLLSAMTGRVVVVHYRHIERDFLARALWQRLGEGIDFPVIDTMALEKRILLQEQNSWQRWLKRPLPSLRLGDCRERYNLPHYQPHHALTDALATAELLQAQIAWHFGGQTPVGDLWY